MSDDLVPRLREFLSPLPNEAADRIEELERQQQYDWDQYIENQSKAKLRIEALEAALREIADNCNPGGDGNLLRAKARRALENKT